MSGCEDDVDKIMASLVHHEAKGKMNRYHSPADGTDCQQPRGDNETVNGRGEGKEEIQLWANSDYNNNNHTRKTL